MKIVLTAAYMIAASFGGAPSPTSTATDMTFSIRCARAGNQQMICMAILPSWLSAYDVRVHNAVRCGLAKTPMFHDLQAARPETGHIDGVFRATGLSAQSVEMTVKADVPVTATSDLQTVEYDMPQQLNVNPMAGCAPYKIEISRRSASAKVYDLFAYVE